MAFSELYLIVGEVLEVLDLFLMLTVVVSTVFLLVPLEMTLLSQLLHVGVVQSLDLTRCDLLVLVLNCLLGDLISMINTRINLISENFNHLFYFKICYNTCQKS